jgi:pimeloyl-ACP methyl ester carboxylesterase
MGGVVARRFAVRYPGDVADMVLVDSSHEGQFRRTGPRFRGVYLRVLAQRAVRPLGLRRLAASADPRRRLNAELARAVPAEHIAAARAIALSSRQRRANVREMLLMARSHGQPPDLGSLPVTVITAATKDPRWASRWGPMQADLAAISTRSKQVMADTGNYVHLDDSALVIKAVSDLLGVIS